MHASLHARVLVVDDDRDFRRVMCAILEDAGYQVFEASNGASALAQLAQLTDNAQLTNTPYGMVVLLDLLMPGMNGFDVLHALAQDEQLASRHAVIVVTAMDTRALPVNMLQQLIGLDVPLLEKPFRIDELLEHVGAAAQRLTRYRCSTTSDA